MRKLFALLLVLSFALPAFAEDESVQDALDGLRARRVRGGYITMAVGASIIIIPNLPGNANSASSTSNNDTTNRLFFSLAGVTVLMSGVRNLMVQSEPERILERMEELRKEGHLTAAVEHDMIVQLAAAAHSDRFWGGATTIVGGTISVVGGTMITGDSSLKTFAVILGGLSIFGGVMQMIKPTRLEKMAEQKLSWDVAPAMIADRKPLPGLGVSLSF